LQNDVMPEEPRAKIWLHEGPEIVGLAGGTAYFWDREFSNVGALGAVALRDGARIESREISDLNINGEPDYIVGAPGAPGKLLGDWGEPVLLQDNGTDRPFSIVWRAQSARWTSAILAGGNLVYWQYEPANGIIALSPVDGTEVWSGSLEPGANGVDLSTDGTYFYAVWQQYSPTAPTPTITVPQRVRAFDMTDGRTLWTRDFMQHTGGIAVADNTVVVAMGSDLLFSDGATGHVIATVATGHPANIYPGMTTAGDVVYVGLRDAVTAYRASTGAQLWQTPVSLDGGPELVVQGERLLVSTGHGSVVSLERGTGQLEWEVGTGVSSYRIYANERGFVTVGSGSAGASFAADLTRRRVVISGRVTAQCLSIAEVVLSVGNRTVSPAADGTFTTAGGLEQASPRGRRDRRGARLRHRRSDAEFL
jgi:hypothetical protein